MVNIGKADFLYYKYFGCELGAQSKFDAKTGISLINGSHDTAKLAGLLENFSRNMSSVMAVETLGLR
jgi:translation initiation factor 5